jgi:hypothetical protein
MQVQNLGRFLDMVDFQDHELRKIETKFIADKKQLWDDELET